MQAPVMVVNTSQGDRKTGRQAQLSNITAAKTVADIIRSCLGPKAMLKMLLDPMGGIVLTNDGHAILREIEVAHPAAKSMIELSRTQDEEVGDGTTSVIILAGEMLAMALPQLERHIHPVVIIQAYKQALRDAVQIIEDISVPIDTSNDRAMISLLEAAIGTKTISRYSELMCDLALKAVRIVSQELQSVSNTTTKSQPNGVNGTHTRPIRPHEIDIKRYARIEKVPGGQIENSRVLSGVMLNKDITHASMRRRIVKPRILLLDCTLEYKKGESQTAVEISDESSWNRILQIEEEQVKRMCDAILQFKPDLVITEKGVSDLAQHHFVRNNVTAIRRVRKSDNNRIARATGATIVNRVEDISESDIGTGAGLFEIEKIGDEYFTFITECANPKACTILLRGPSKDILNEIERNLQDAMSVARNVMFSPRMSPGGGATEMAVAVKLAQKSKAIEGVMQWPYRAVAEAMEVIPRTLVLNAGGSPIRVLTELRAKWTKLVAGQGVDTKVPATGVARKDVAGTVKVNGSVAQVNGTKGEDESGIAPMSHQSWGIDGDRGVVVDSRELGVWEPMEVKVQSVKTAIESACLLLRVDDICAAKGGRPGGGSPQGGED